MSKEFFAAENLDDYRNDELIMAGLNGRTLLNHDEFMDWYYPTRSPSSMGNRGKSLWRKAISKVMLLFLTENVCEKKIDFDYGRTAIENLKKSVDFDLLVVLEKDYLEVKESSKNSTLAKSSKLKINCILGFIIVEKGECRRFRSTYTVNLICARSFNPKNNTEYNQFEKIRGALLLGAYMYCAKKMNQDLGMLELAGGYHNLTGFFSYSKMGFISNLELFGKDCFNYYINLPMSLELKDFSYEYIISLAVGNKKIKNFKDETGLIHIIPEPGNEKQQVLQRNIALYCNLLYQLPYYLNYRIVYIPHLDSREMSVMEEIDHLYDIHIMNESRGSSDDESDGREENEKFLFYKNFLENKQKENIRMFHSLAINPKKGSPSPHDVDEDEFSDLSESVKSKNSESEKQIPRKSVLQRLSAAARRFTTKRRTSSVQAKPPSRRYTQSKKNKTASVKPPSSISSRTMKIKKLATLSRKLTHMGLPV